MTVHLVNPSDKSFGTAVITPRWLYVLAAATPDSFGDAQICDETLEQLDPLRVEPGDVVGIGIHTGNALRGYEIGRMVTGARRVGGFRRNTRHSLSRRSVEVRKCSFGSQGRRRCRLGGSVERLA